MGKHEAFEQGFVKALTAIGDAHGIADNGHAGGEGHTGLACREVARGPFGFEMLSRCLECGSCFAVIFPEADRAELKPAFRVKGRKSAAGAGKTGEHEDYSR